MVMREGGRIPLPESVRRQDAGLSAIPDRGTGSGAAVNADDLHAVVAAAHELFGEPNGLRAGHRVFAGQLPGGKKLELRIYRNPEISLFASVSGAGCEGACQMSLRHAPGDGLKLSPCHTSLDRDAAEVAADTCHLVLAGAQRKLPVAEQHPQTFA